jgi:arginyl-tRNA--protein-N-Asp/Glu arginylyltransferase
MAIPYEIINEMQSLYPMPGTELDRLLEGGWRFLGNEAVRHNVATWKAEVCGTVPARIRLSEFFLSTSQKKLLKKNAGLRVESGPICIDSQKTELFDKHTARIRERTPDSLFSFLNVYPEIIPGEGREFRVFAGNELIACSSIHLGEKAVSATYCIFSPDYGQFSPGIFTMLLEILYSIGRGMEFYYPGYVYSVPSQFDYKLNFHGTEQMNWNSGIWTARERVPPGKYQTQG